MLSLKDDLVGDIKRVLWVLMGTIGLVLLVACANVANLLLVRAESRQQEISDISRSLKALAKELNVPVIALSQLSRAVEARKPPIPMLADLRESGAIEQDADVVMFIYREDVYDQNSERKGIADILVSKHRNGPIGKKELFFHDRYAKFESLDNREVV